MPRILLTAFEPFAGAAINASEEVARRIAADDESVRLAVLPVVRGEAERIALGVLRDLARDGGAPDLVLSLGEAARPHVCLESVAVNRDDFPIPDNAGNQPRGAPILPEGPAAYPTTLPVVDLADRLQGTTSVPIVISADAGTYLCNHIAYCLAHELDGSGTPCGFVHVPAVRPGDIITLEAVAQTVRALLDGARAWAARRATTTECHETFYPFET